MAGGRHFLWALAHYAKCKVADPSPGDISANFPFYELFFFRRIFFKMCVCVCVLRNEVFVGLGRVGFGSGFSFCLLLLFFFISRAGRWVGGWVEGEGGSSILVRRHVAARQGSVASFAYANEGLTLASRARRLAAPPPSPTYLP